MAVRRYSALVFERFTERARQVVVLAQDEARAFKHNYIGTEHLLLGLLREEEGLAARVLESLDVTVEEVRAGVARVVGQGDEVTSGQIPFTPRSKKVLELALREALSLGHNYIGTEHVLLGLVRENEGVAARILLDFDADAEKIRNEIIRMLSGSGRREMVYHPPIPVARRPTPTRRLSWEYRIELWPAAEPDARREQLDDLGTDGWQLAAVVSGSGSSEWVFMRQRTEYRWSTADIDVAGPRRALTVGQVEDALADAQKAALEASDAGRVTSIAELEGEFRGLIQRVVDAVDIEQEGELGSLALDVLVERVSATKEGLIEAQDFQQAASLRNLERQFHRTLGDIYAALRDAKSS